MTFALHLIVPALSDILVACLILCLIGALFTLIQGKIAEPFRSAVLIIAAFALVLWALRLFGVL